MKKELKNWKNFLAEADKLVQDRYEANLYLAIEQSKDIDRTDVTNQMRAIPEVTTVYREREISTSESQFVGEYIIRFILPKQNFPQSPDRKIQNWPQRGSRQIGIPILVCPMPECAH